jgi:hypothetical protein
MATGEDSGTWGQITNTNLGTALEEAIVGSTDVLFSGSDVTLTLTNTNTSQPARNMRLNLTGSSGGARTLTVPSIEKSYIVNNNLADAVDIRNATGTGVIVPASKSMVVYSTGTGVVNVTTHATSLSLTNALALTSGGTNATTAAGARISILPAYATNANKALVVNSGATDVEYATVGNVLTTAAQPLTNKTIAATRESVNIQGSSASSVVNLFALTASVLYYTVPAGGNWTLNVTGDGSTTLNSIMAVGDAITVAFMCTNGSSAYRQTALTVDSNAVTPNWQGGSAPTTGNANSIDSYIATLIKTGAGTFVVLEAQTRFA